MIAGLSSPAPGQEYWGLWLPDEKLENTFSLEGWFETENAALNYGDILGVEEYILWDYDPE